MSDFCENKEPQTYAFKDLNCPESQILSLISHGEWTIQHSMLCGTACANIILVVPLSFGETTKYCVFSLSSCIFLWWSQANYRVNQSVPVPCDITGKGSLAANHLCQHFLWSLSRQWRQKTGLYEGKLLQLCAASLQMLCLLFCFVSVTALEICQHEECVRIPLWMTAILWILSCFNVFLTMMQSSGLSRPE